MPKAELSIEVPGTILFSKFAFSPNRLKYCGPDANLDLFEYTARNLSDRGLIEILEEFEGAFPYLELIANQNKINDPFDQKVVEAYWIGNDLLKNIQLEKFYHHLKERFKPRIKTKSFHQLVSKIPRGAKPHHSFHVLEIYHRLGGIRGIDLGPILSTINHCLISWAKILKINQDQLEVEYQPIIFNQKLTFGPKITKKVNYKFKEQSFLTIPKTGDWIAIHWDWPCELLTSRQLTNLKKWTLYHLSLANSTF